MASPRLHAWTLDVVPALVPALQTQRGPVGLHSLQAQLRVVGPLLPQGFFLLPLCSLLLQSQ